MDKEIYFRVDSSYEMGIGHAMRCLALANRFLKNGWNCHFICKQHNGSIQKIIEQSGHDVNTLKIDTDFVGLNEYECWVGSTQIDDAKYSLDYIGVSGGLVVVDHYGLDKTWEELIKPKVNYLAVIDDLANRDHDCDVLIDSKYGRIDAAYDSLIKESTKLLVGAKYCILRDEFCELISEAKEKRKQTKKIKTVLINFGGTDPKGYSELVVDIMRKNFNNLSLELVVGSNHKSLSKFKEIGLPNINVHVDTSEMALIILRCDFAIGSYGGSSWERCALGLPSIGLVSADNQKGIAKSLHDAGASMLISKDELLNELNGMLLEDFSWWPTMSQKAFDICDGEGVSRIVSYIEGLH